MVFAHGRGARLVLPVDPRNGDIYTGEIHHSGPSIVSKYDAAGAHLGTFEVAADYRAWIAVDAAGYLYIAESHDIVKPAPGQYAVMVRSQETASDVDPTRPWVNFVVE